MSLIHSIESIIESLDLEIKFSREVPEFKDKDVCFGYVTTKRNGTNGNVKHLLYLLVTETKMGSLELKTLDILFDHYLENVLKTKLNSILVKKEEDLLRLKQVLMLGSHMKKGYLYNTTPGKWARK